MNNMKRLIVVALLVAAVGVVLAIRQKPHQNSNPAEPKEVAQEKPLPRLVDLGANKCMACKMMIPVLDKLREDFADQMKVDFIDVWENPGAGQHFGVRVIPTQIFFSPEGEELFRHEGFMSREDILAKWNEFNYEF